MVNSVAKKKMNSVYPMPIKQILSGHYCELHPFDQLKHAESLYAAFMLDRAGIGWNYLPYGPFANRAEFYDWLLTAYIDLPIFYTIVDQEKLKPMGLVSFLNIRPEHGSIEIGHVHFSPLLQQTTAATESLYLMMKMVFDNLGYRRIEWKCDNANERSKHCAIRLGFQFEGLFRQHLIYKSRNRDTAWFSIIDKEWPNIKTRSEQWLSPDNFDSKGQQIKKLRNGSVAS